ncbi:MAG: hypothetical protein AAB676_08705, partial [Verrucomicrobiota bacterium]
MEIKVHECLTPNRTPNAIRGRSIRLFESVCGKSIGGAVLVVVLVLVVDDAFVFEDEEEDENGEEETVWNFRTRSKPYAPKGERGRRANSVRHCTCLS